MDHAAWHERTRSASSESFIDALHSPAVSNMMNIGPSSAPASASPLVSNITHSSSPSTGQLSNSLRDAVRRAAINDSSSTDSSSQPEIIFDSATTYGHANANTNAHANPTSPPSAANTNSQPQHTQTKFCSKEQERKELILYLLAQVCALHDSTPKTFIVHVLSLYESGILDDGSLRLLTQQGLVPSANELLTENNNMTHAADPTHEHAHGQKHGQQQGQLNHEGCIVRGVENKLAMEYYLEKNTEGDQEQEQLDANIDVGAIVPYKSASMEIINGPEIETMYRAHRVFAIRKHLENHEAMANYKSRTASWSVEQHPLSFSRYNREFVQKKMLASGSFGQVFHAVNKMDGCDYAVKKVMFSAKGYDTKQVETVIREVQILAKMGHDNVVRYYTSWLEPVWGENGDGDSNFDGDESDSDESSTSQNTMTSTKLLLGPTDWAETGFDFTQRSLENELMNDGGKCDSHAGLSAWSFERSKNDGTQDDWDQLISHHTNASKSNGISTGEYGMESEYSEWTVEQRSRMHRMRNTTTSKYSSSKMHQSTTSGKSSQHKQRPKKNEASVYKYQICLYIQMQLCRPSTLADWIRNRNGVKYPQLPPAQKQRYLDAAAIFKQISCGLAHIHSRGIVHRDLKPANIFQSVEDESFKIGDFGLSKILQTANCGIPFDSDPGTMIVPINQNASSGAWDDPLTAGVGTSSYAAPEQLSSQNYGSEADVFSLGLILLELVSSFGSAHERALTFLNCRKGILPEWLTSSHPLTDVCALILSCTNQRSEERPTASDLLQRELFSSAHVADMQSNVIKNLEVRLKKKEQENQLLHRIIKRHEEELKRVGATHGYTNRLENKHDINDFSDDDY